MTPSRQQRAGLAVFIAASMAACSPASDTPKPSSAGATPAPASANGAAAAAYQRLETQFGEDYAACGASLRANAAACSDGSVGDSQLPPRILLMLDSSGSMAARLGGSSKMQAAKDALLTFVGNASPDSEIGLRVYGHTGSNAESRKAESCRGTALVHPFEAVDKERFRRALDSFQPTGWTPIGGALQAAAGDFGSSSGAKRSNVIYLVSDGIETCGGDPATAAGALRNSGVQVTVNVIGFGVDEATARQLRPIAAAGGGEYLSANDGASLTRLFNERVGQASARFNCAVGAQSDAFNTTVKAQSERFNCLVDKASDEFNAMVAESGRLQSAGEIDAFTRDYIRDQARAKRESIIEPARRERDAVMDAAKQGRETAVGSERSLRDQRIERARSERAGASDP